MHHIHAFFILILLFIFTACEDKTPKNYTSHDTLTTQAPTLSDTFILSNNAGDIYTVTVSNKKVTFKESMKAITLLSFFATWCQPCLHEIPDLNDLYYKYQDKLLLASILIHDPISKQALENFTQAQQIQHYVSNSIQNNDFAQLISKTLQLPKRFSIPLTVMYVEGEYFTHYEGNVPVEMIEYDIDQALQTLE
ncbi:MAG: redoxin domain-containing protein [Sulfurovum sp.]|nr:redoxin domain-containing protein [Sulfurovum sp.]